MRRTRLAGMNALAVLLFAGCSATSAAWRFNRIDPSDFPDGDLRNGGAKALGSVMLRQAVSTDPVVAKLCDDEGTPDAIALGPDSSSLELAYLPRHTVYTVSRVPNGPSTVTVRLISDPEVAAIDQRIRPVAIPNAPPAGNVYERSGRVLATLNRVVGAVPPNDLQLRSGHYHGFVSMAYPPDPYTVIGPDLVTQSSSQEVFVTWVDPRGPAAGLVEVGDKIDAVDGVGLASEQRLYDGWVAARTLTLQRGDSRRDVSVTPQEWPFDLRAVVVTLDAPIAISAKVEARGLFRPPGLSVAIAEAGEILVIVSTGLLARLDDDGLAWVLSHELAHVALGHLSRTPTVADHIETVFTAVLLPTMFVPLAGPALNAALTGAASGIRRHANRDQERLADRLGTVIACHAGVDAGAGPRVMDALSTGPQAPLWRQFLDEHPPYDERATTIASVASQTCRAAEPSAGPRAKRRGESASPQRPASNRTSIGRTEISVLMASSRAPIRNNGGCSMRLVLSAVMLVTAFAGGAAAQCCGDCRGDGRVTIDDLITSVNNALSNCGAPTPTAERTATPTRRPTATRTPADVCRSTFTSNSGGACVFRGRYNRGCGDELNATFASNGTTVIVTIDTMLSSPPRVRFSARVDTATAASLTGWSTNDFGTTNPTAGDLDLSDDGGQLVVFPNHPPFMIQGCNFTQYIGDYVGAAGLDAVPGAPDEREAAAFERIRTRAAEPPPELEDP